VTSLNLPLLENFNDRKPANYTLSRASSTGTIGYESTGPVNLDGVKMSGAAGAGLLFGLPVHQQLHLQIIQTILKIIFL
jgi:hypothetical protein